MSRIVIVGANHAGTAAANAILDNHPGNEVVIIDQNSNISFLGCGMALWIGRQISGPGGLFYQTKEGFEAKGATVHMETRVESVDYDAQVVHAVAADGTRVDQPYDKLILATGSLPIIPRIEGIDLENVQRVKLFQDARAVVDKLKDPSIRRVTVVGAGYIGVELAEAFQRNGREVTLVDMAPTCVSSNFDEKFCDLMAENLRSHGIELAFGEKVLCLEGEGGKVARVVTDKGAHQADLVCMCIGFKPNTELFAGAGFDTLRNGALLVDHHQETSRRGVYAVGDCSSCFYNAKDGEPAYIALATNAVRSGIVAGHNACGAAIEGVGVQGSSGICIYDLKMVATGLTEAAARKAGYDVRVSDFSQVQKATFVEGENPEVKIRVVFDGTTRRVLGAQMASTYDMSAGIHMFSLAIQEGLTIDRLALLDGLRHRRAPEPEGAVTPEGASRTDSRPKSPLRRRFLAGGATSPRSRRCGFLFPGNGIPLPGNKIPSDTHSSCERVSTWARHRFVYECVSVEKDAGTSRQGEQYPRRIRPPCGTLLEVPITVVSGR